MNSAMFVLLAAGLLLGAAASANAATATVTGTATASAGPAAVSCTVTVTATVPTDGSAPTVSDPTPQCTGV